VVEVPEELIRLTAELCIEAPRTRIPCTAGLQFASRYDRRHRFVQDTLRDAGVEAVPMKGFAVWAAKMRPLIQ